jgi:hypothetical protein
MNMIDKLPSQKLSAGALAALAMLIAIQVVNTHFIADNPLPDMVQNGLVLLAYGITGYFVRPSATDVAKVVD